MTDMLTKMARGRDCQIRLPGICCFDPETTVLAHVRLPGVSGFGIKAHSMLGAWACYRCHQAVDSPATHGLDRDAAMLAHLQGVMRTQDQLLAEGVIHVARPGKKAA